MESIVLQAEPRGVGRHPLREVRDGHRVPAVVYGSGVVPQAVALDERALLRALHEAGSGLLSLRVADREPIQVLTRAIQRHPVKRNLLHVDFQVVSMTQVLRLQVAVELEGVAAISSVPNMLVVRQLDSVEIECLPADIPARLVADASRLLTVDDEILVRDLALPPGVRVLTDPARVVYSVTMSRVVEEEVEAVEVVTSEVEVVAKGKAARGEEETAES